MKLTDNFNLSEFRSKDGANFPKDVFKNIQELANNLQVIRDNIKVPITITSGYRSPSHNAKIKGARNSFHVKGMAVDLQARGFTPKDLAAAIEFLIDSGAIKQGGIGIYRTWVHYDTRGTKARW